MSESANIWIGEPGMINWFRWSEKPVSAALAQ